MVSLLSQITTIVANSVDELGEVHNTDCIEEIRDLFKLNNTIYEENYNYYDGGPGYEQEFYVFSWIEDNHLYTYDVLVESY